MTSLKKAALVVTVVLGLAAGPLPAAFAAPSTTPSAVVGRVFQPNLVSPAADLTVQAYPDGAKAPVASVTTDAKGRFELHALPAGHYVLLLSTKQGPVAATKIETREGTREELTLALPDRKPGEGSMAPGATHGGFAAWLATPVGATVAVVATAVVVSVGAHQITKDDNKSEPPVSPSR